MVSNLFACVPNLIIFVLSPHHIKDFSYAIRSFDFNHVTPSNAGKLLRGSDFVRVKESQKTLLNRERGQLKLRHQTLLGRERTMKEHTSKLLLGR